VNVALLESWLERRCNLVKNRDIETKIRSRERGRRPGQMMDLVEEYWDLEEIERLYERKSNIVPDDFRDAFHQRFSRRGQLLLTGSARLALWTLLVNAAHGSTRRRVLLSSFNCRVVKEAVLKAGLAVDTFDFSTGNGRIDWEAVGGSLRDEHLAVVVPHFFGIPTDFFPMLSAARRKNVLIFEDCAHALGASISGTIAGQIGDAAIFSFNYDKPISLAGGGALLINNSAIKIDKETVEAIPPRRLELSQFRQMASALRYGRTRRERRSLITRIGGKLHALPRLPAGIGLLRAAVGIWQLERYDEIREKRDRNARLLEDSLGHLSWHVAANVKPAYLKLRIMVDPAGAASAVRQCRECGIAVANSNWPRPIEANENARPSVHAHRAAAFGLDVPVHQNLSATHLAQIASAFAAAKAPALHDVMARRLP
jgi:dTDP-4-amino-4,6-dideoxygalactose transaminase